MTSIKFDDLRIYLNNFGQNENGNKWIKWMNKRIELNEMNEVINEIKWIDEMKWLY